MKVSQYNANGSIARYFFVIQIISLKPLDPNDNDNDEIY